MEKEIPSSVKFVSSVWIAGDRDDLFFNKVLESLVNGISSPASQESSNQLIFIVELEVSCILRSCVSVLLCNAVALASL